MTTASAMRRRRSTRFPIGPRSRITGRTSPRPMYRPSKGTTWVVMPAWIRSPGTGFFMIDLLRVRGWRAPQRPQRWPSRTGPVRTAAEPPLRSRVRSRVGSFRVLPIGAGTRDLVGEERGDPHAGPLAVAHLLDAADEVPLAVPVRRGDELPR